MKEVLNILFEFVEDQQEETLEVAHAGPLWNKDPFLRIKRDVIVPNAQLRQGDTNVKENEGEDDEKEEEEAPTISEPRKLKRAVSKIDQKGKDVVEFSEKLKKKKALLKIGEVPRRK